MVFKVAYLVLISVREFEHFGSDLGFLSLVVALALVSFELDEVTRSCIRIVELLCFTSLTPNERVSLWPKRRVNGEHSIPHPRRADLRSSVCISATL
jgi:hypothetical protein